jgi:hypothetical protein
MDASSKHPPEETQYPTLAGFSEPPPDAELLHQESPDADFTQSETSYLGFNIPEAGIDCMIYHWFHPHLQVMSGGILLYQGYKQFTGQGEYVDYRNFLPYPDQIEDVRYPTGVHVKVIEPLSALDLDFASPDGSVRFEVACRAIMPAAERPDRAHFAQAMRCEGELVLGGTTYPIDGFYTRDRSYSQPRPEDPHPIAPTTWVVAVFGEELAFHIVGSDTDELTDEQLRWGYVWNDGQLRRPVKMRKSTVRADDGMTPIGTTIELEDETGETYLLEGTGIANLPMSFWPNMTTHLMLTEYRLGDRIGHGDYQDVHFGHWLRSIPTRQPSTGR